MANEQFKEVDLGVCSAFFSGSDEDTYFNNLQAFVSSHPSLLNFSEANIRSDSVCIDVGANIGATAILLSKICPNGWVYAFEPSPVNAAFLRKNIARNEIENCTVIEAGVGHKLATLKFHSSAFGAGSHFVSRGHVRPERLETTNVPVVTLDHFMSSRNAPKRIDFIKIDAEGFEPAVIAGARRLMKDCRILTFMEFNTWALYYGHRFDPYAFISSIWDVFDIFNVEYDGSLTPVADVDALTFLCYNMTARGCVDDIIIRAKPGKSVPSFRQMTLDVSKSTYLRRLILSIGR